MARMREAIEAARRWGARGRLVHYVARRRACNRAEQPAAPSGTGLAPPSQARRSGKRTWPACPGSSEPGPGWSPARGSKCRKSRHASDPPGRRCSTLA